MNRGQTAVISDGRKTKSLNGLEGGCHEEGAIRGRMARCRDIEEWGQNKCYCEFGWR